MLMGQVHLTVHRTKKPFGGDCCLIQSDDLLTQQYLALASRSALVESDRTDMPPLKVEIDIIILNVLQSSTIQTLFCAIELPSAGVTVSRHPNKVDVKCK